MVGTDFSMATLKGVRRATRARGAGREGVIIDDVENILEAHGAGVRIDRAFFTLSEKTAAVALAEAGVPVVEVSPEQTREIFGVERSSRVFALAHPSRPRHLASLRDLHGDLVVLDGVRLVGNIGAIIRTTVALGGSGVVLLNSGLASVYDRRLIRASRGLVFRIPVVLSEPATVVRFCEERNIPLMAGSAHRGMDVAHLALLPMRVALVLGGERHGCSVELEEGVTAQLHIATSSRVESLNVSVAAGIMLNIRANHNLSGDST